MMYVFAAIMLLGILTAYSGLTTYRAYRHIKGVCFMAAGAVFVLAALSMLTG